MSPSCQSKENDSFQYLFPCVLLQTSDHLKPCRAVSPCIYFSMGDLSEWESQPGSAVVMLYQDQHPNFTHGLTFHLLNSQSTITWDPCFNSEVESCPFLSLFFFFVCFVAPGLTLGCAFGCLLFCFVSWWWGPVIDGRGPGHLRSTAVDSSEIESSSRSVTMSSLRSWLGRQPSKPSKLGGLHEFQLGTRMWVHMEIVQGKGLNQEYIPDN